MKSILSCEEASELLGVELHTLERWRSKGTGPRFAKLGRFIRYRLSDVEAWIEANMCSSTSEYETSRPKTAA